MGLVASLPPVFCMKARILSMDVVQKASDFWVVLTQHSAVLHHFGIHTFLPPSTLYSLAVQKDNMQYGALNYVRFERAFLARLDLSRSNSQ